MTEILLIRHGETAWNAKKRLQGHLDIPLSHEGERQAAALGHALHHEELDAVISSDLQRAVQTAKAVADRKNMPVVVDPALRERCYGGFEGLLYGEIQQRFPDQYAAWRRRELDARPPAGLYPAETLREFAERVMNAILGVVNAGGYRKCAIVAHGGVLECVYRAAEGTGFAQPRDFDILNASINRFRTDGARLELVHWGDISHLESMNLQALDEIDRPHGQVA